jgi:translation elongation factor EF-Tu-like GTPase
MRLFDNTARQDAEALAEIARIRHAPDPGPSDTERLYHHLRERRSRAVRAAAVQALRALQERFEGVFIIDGPRFVGIDGPAYADDKFFLYVLDVFGVEGKGASAVGYVSSGAVEIGQPLILEKADGRDLPTRCTEIRQLRPPEGVGGCLGVFLADLTMGEISQGDALRAVS